MLIIKTREVLRGLLGTKRRRHVSAWTHFLGFRDWDFLMVEEVQFFLIWVRSNTKICMPMHGTIVKPKWYVLDKCTFYVVTIKLRSQFDSTWGAGCCTCNSAPSLLDVSPTLSKWPQKYSFIWLILKEIVWFRITA